MEALIMPYLYQKIERLPSRLQEEVSLFIDFLLAKNNIEPNIDLDSATDDNHFSRFSLLSLSKEWNSSEDEEWDAILSEMPSIQ